MTKQPPLLLPATKEEQQVLEAIRGLRYGAVEIIIHDSRIVQLERSEKMRFEPKS
jgi:hypothetical protein